MYILILNQAQASSRYTYLYSDDRLQTYSDSIFIRYHCSSSDLLRRGEVLRDGLRAEPGDVGAGRAAGGGRAAEGDGGGVGGDQEEGPLPPEAEGDQTGEMLCDDTAYGIGWPIRN